MFLYWFNYPCDQYHERGVAQQRRQNMNSKQTGNRSWNFLFLCEEAPEDHVLREPDLDCVWAGRLFVRPRFFDCPLLIWRRSWSQSTKATRTGVESSQTVSRCVIIPTVILIKKLHQSHEKMLNHKSVIKLMTDSIINKISSLKECC